MPFTGELQATSEEHPLDSLLNLSTHHVIMRVSAKKQTKIFPFEYFFSLLTFWRRYGAIAQKSFDQNKMYAEDEKNTINKYAFVVVFFCIKTNRFCIRRDVNVFAHSHSCVYQLAQNSSVDSMYLLLGYCVFAVLFRPNFVLQVNCSPTIKTFINTIERSDGGKKSQSSKQTNSD